MSWLDDIPGIVDLIDGTGEVDIIVPRQKNLRFEGVGVEVLPDPVNGLTRIRIRGALKFTALKSTNYAAQYGDHVLMGAGAGTRTVSLPLAASLKNGQVGVLNTVAAAVNVAPSGSDTLQGSAGPVAINNANTSIICQSDGVSAWRIVAAYLT